MMSAKLSVFSGGSLQLSGGEISLPSHVYFLGIIAPWVNAELVRFIVGPPFCVEVFSLEHPARSALPSIKIMTPLIALGFF
jgi:hypothetical protein